MKYQTATKITKMDKSEIIADGREADAEEALSNYAIEARDIFVDQGVYSFEEMDDKTDQEILDLYVARWGNDLTD